MFFGKKQEITHAETTVCARAKINLTLDVTGRRADGYHTVRMVMQSVALHDEVRVVVTQGEKKPRGIILTCNLPYLPVDERNLAFRAAELFYKETGVLMGTCEIHIEKRIPIAAGLAGGSSDAAAVLRALAAPLGDGLHQRADLLGDAALAADDLAHVLGRDMQLKDRGLGSDGLLNGHGILVIHQRPRHVCNELFHALSPRSRRSS